MNLNLWPPFCKIKIASNICNGDLNLNRFKNAFNFSNKYWDAAKTKTDLKYIRTLLKILTRVPYQSTSVCVKCDMQYNDLSLHILTECNCTSLHRELFMDCVAIYFPLEMYNSLATLSKDELLLSILGKHFTDLFSKDNELHSNFILLTAAYANTAYTVYYN